MRLLRVAIAVSCSACGRIAFDPVATADAPSAGDTLIAVDGLDPSLAFWLPVDTDTSDVVTQRPTTCVTSCPQQIAGRGGTVLRFTGQMGQCLTLPDDGSMDLAQFTLAMWTYKDVEGEFSYLAKPFDPVNTVFNSWQFEDHTTLQFGFTTHNADRHDIVFTNDAPAGAWHHLAASFDGVTKRIYVDGVLGNQVAEPDAVQYDASGLLIGCDINNNAPAYPFSGMVDDVRIYKRALSDAEIAGLAQP